MCKNKTKMVLIISLLLNFVLVGLFAFNKCYMASLKNWHQLDLSIVEQSDIPTETKQLIINTMKAMKEQRKSQYMEILAIKSELNKILAAENFDQQAYQEKTSKIKTIKSKMYTTNSESMLNLIKKLEAKERQILAKALEKKYKSYKSKQSE